MPLVSITLNGFKSFADKTTIEFNNGITGIVGPNGSGKSNITEALRWVMGESSAKSLRGDSMADVIFGGSEYRSPLNRAEVTFQFDNQQHQLKLDVPQVEVTRRVTRNGESDYLINKKNVRLKDVHSLFMDSGLSRDSFSIISQGRVEEIFNSRAENRRSIIEEAAGILHFKQQKKSAEQQMEQTTDNLIRISDLINELEGRVEPLHEQSSLAKEYQSQKIQLDYKQKALMAFEIQELLEERVGVQAANDKISAMAKNLDQQVEETQKNLDQARDLANENRAEKDCLQQALTNLETKIADLTTNLKISDQSKEYDVVAKQELEQQQIENEAKITELKQQIAELKSQLEQLTEQEKTLTDLEKELKSQINADPAELQEQLEALRSQYIEDLQAQTTNKNDLLYLQSELTKVSNQETSSSNYLDHDLKKVKEQLTTLTANKDDLTTQQTKISKSLNENQAQAEEFAAQFEYQKAELETSGKKLQKIQAEISTLKRFQERHEGYYYGVKNILNQSQKFPGILGTFGDLINFEPRYQDALNAALGSHVQSLVAQNQAQAKAAIKTLKTNNLGRATFLPLDVLKTRQVDANILKNLSNIDGFIGTLDSVVEQQQDISAAVNFLLGNILLASDIDAATKIAQMSNHRFRIVTLDGDILSPGGTMTGGAKLKSNNPLLENKSRLNKLIDEEKKLITQENKGKKIALDFQDKLVNIQKNIDLLINQLQEVNEKLTALGYQESSLLSDQKRFEQTLLIEKNKQKQKDEEKSELTTRIEEAKAEKIKLEKAVEETKNKTAKLQALISDFDKQYQKIQAQLSDLMPQLAVLNTKSENISSQISDKTSQLNNLNDLFESTKLRIEKLNSNSVMSKQKIAEAKEELENLAEEKKITNDKLTKLVVQIEIDQSEITKLEQATNRNYDLRKNATREQSEVSVKLAKINSKIDQKVTFLSEEYAISYEAAAEETKDRFKIEEIDNLARDVKLHKMSIAEIGPVNINAIAEYEEVKSRYDFLKGQETDLLTAKADLTNSMDELDQEVKSRFKATFDKINAAFSEIFPVMFGGGSAKLVLTDPDDLLTTGLEIIAQPPGKKLQQLSLLSGGERALTAITLLFAILKVNPVPFCILDEVEASLDEANVVRFAKFLQNYDLTTQFIVITHRQGTMEQADQLYGVVMQESGVSKILSVSLKDLKEE